MVNAGNFSNHLCGKASEGSEAISVRGMLRQLCIPSSGTGLNVLGGILVSLSPWTFGQNSRVSEDGKRQNLYFSFEHWLFLFFSHEEKERGYIWTECLGFPVGASGKESTCQYRRQKRYGFDPWVREIPWGRAWQPTPVFLPGESP